MTSRSRSCPVRGRRTPCSRAAAEHIPEYEYDDVTLVDVEYADVTLVDLHGRPLPEPRKPSSLSDAALLERFTVAGTRAGAGAALCLRAGGLRAALQLSDDELQREGFDAARLRTAVEIGTRYTSAAVEPGETLTSPATTRTVLLARLRERPHEIFACLFLDNRHRIVGFKEMFRGTIDGASVHPREVAKRALELNAAAVVVAHNHPSGVAEPSRSDRAITNRRRDALALVEVRLIDHFVIGDGETVSFAERGWL